MKIIDREPLDKRRIESISVCKPDWKLLQLGHSFEKFNNQRYLWIHLIIFSIYISWSGKLFCRHDYNKTNSNAHHECNKCFKRKAIRHVVERTRKVQYDCMGYPLRLVKMSDGTWEWRDTCDEDGDIILQPAEVLALNAELFKKGELK